MPYRTKADHIRVLLREGHSKGETARMVGASYTQVHGLWKQMSGVQQSLNIRASLPKPAKPFVPGARVVHRRQVDKSIFGVVVRSGPQATVVMFPGKKQKRLGGAHLYTRDLIRAPGGPYDKQ